jgi:hypothetical protein
MKKLDLNELDVTSFETTPYGLPSYEKEKPTLTTTDPTARTYCFVCPVEPYPGTL